MIGDFELKASYAEGMREVTRRLSDGHLERMRSSAIGGASVSMAIVLVLLQRGADSVALQVSLSAAVLAIPTWIAAWQFVEAYIFYGRASIGHFSTTKAAVTKGIIATSGMLLLAVSITALVWHLAPAAAIAFAGAVVAVVMLVARHDDAVRRFTESAEADTT